MFIQALFYQLFGTLAEISLTIVYFLGNIIELLPVKKKIIFLENFLIKNGIYS